MKGIPVKPLRVGLIGTGGIMRDAHMNGWTTLVKEGRVELVAACDVRREPAQALADEHKIPHVFEDFQEMLRQTDLDLVDIATPNMAHAPAALAAFKAGCHVYCEKPLAPTPADVQKLIAARDKAGKCLMTGQHMRFEGKHEALKRYADAGVLGDVYYSHVSALRRRGAPGWGAFLTKSLSGGGPLIDIGVHILDLTLWMMGSRVRWPCRAWRPRNWRTRTTSSTAPAGETGARAASRSSTSRTLPPGSSALPTAACCSWRHRSC
jgi:predicted dehydrogenase